MIIIFVKSPWDCKNIQTFEPLGHSTNLIQMKLLLLLLHPQMDTNLNNASILKRHHLI